MPNPLSPWTGYWSGQEEAHRRDPSSYQSFNNATRKKIPRTHEESVSLKLPKEWQSKEPYKALRGLDICGDEY